MVSGKIFYTKTWNRRKPVLFIHDNDFMGSGHEDKIVKQLSKINTIPYNRFAWLWLFRKNQTSHILIIYMYN